MSEKKPTQSLTIRASVAQVVLPILTFYLAQTFGLEEAQAAELAGAVFAIALAVAQIGMRRAIGFVFFLVMVGACCRDPKPLANSYRRWLKGPGKAWVEQAKEDKRFDQSDALDRQARWDTASALVDSYERE